MIVITCPVCGCQEGRALGETNVLIKCRKCSRYFWFAVNSKGIVSSAEVVSGKTQRENEK